MNYLLLLKITIFYFYNFFRITKKKSKIKFIKNIPLIIPSLIFLKKSINLLMNILIKLIESLMILLYKFQKIFKLLNINYHT